MITVPQARERAKARLSAKLAQWATDAARAQTVFGSDPQSRHTSKLHPALFSLLLKPPTEREVLINQLAAEEWAAQWTEIAKWVEVARHTTPEPGLHVDFEERTWKSIGKQRIPVRISFYTASAVATFVGGKGKDNWFTLASRTEAVYSQLTALGTGYPVTEFMVANIGAAIRRHASRILTYSPTQFEQVVRSTLWVIENPVTGFRPRQVPIRGVDSKWFSAHRAVVSELVGAVTGATDLGIVDADRLIRVRILDHTLVSGGPIDFSAPASELALQHWQPALVLICENKESVLALPQIPGVIAIHGDGYAINVVGQLPWVQGAPVLYWGDLDSHGFGILHRLRGTHPHVVSTLMDQGTVLNHLDLCVIENKPTPGIFSNLTPAELQALTYLRAHGNLRLEQERIPWATALATIHAAIGSIQVA